MLCAPSLEWNLLYLNAIKGLFPIANTFGTLIAWCRSDLRVKLTGNGCLAVGAQAGHRLCPDQQQKTVSEKK
jgi:hypothetical protein